MILTEFNYECLSLCITSQGTLHTLKNFCAESTEIALFLLHLDMLIYITAFLELVVAYSIRTRRSREYYYYCSKIFIDHRSILY